MANDNDEMPAASQGPDQADTSVLTHGAILFDVDETILNVTVDRIQNARLEETLAESPALPVIAELLVKGFALCAITGNDLKKFERRFVAPLHDFLDRHGELRALQRFEVYGNGAATHRTFDGYGDGHDDEPYNALGRIPEGHHTIIVDVLHEVADSVNGQLGKDLLERDYDVSMWAYEWDGSARRWFAEEAGTRRAIPWVAERGDRAMVTLKPLPSQKHIRRKGEPDLRESTCAQVQARLSARLGADVDQYTIIPGGWSSIDVTRCITKGHAVEHYLARHALAPHTVLYLGNEFFPGGNDQSVLDRIEGIHAIAVNQDLGDVFHLANVIWGGARGVLSAEHHLIDVLERHAVAEFSARMRPDEPSIGVPVLREKLRDAYAQKVRAKQQLLDRLAAPTDGIQLDVLRDTVGLLDRAIAKLTQRQPGRLADH